MNMDMEADSEAMECDSTSPEIDPKYVVSLLFIPYL